MWSPSLRQRESHICRRDFVNRENFFEWASAKSLYDYMISEVENNVGTLRLKFPRAIVYLTSLIGINLSKNCLGSSEEDQVILDRAIWRVNNEIHLYNNSVGLLTPWISRNVHYYSKKQKRNYYHLLEDHDGIHYKHDLQQKIAHALTVHIKKTHNNHVIEGKPEINYDNYTKTEFD